MITIHREDTPGSLRSYTVGFVLSLLLTIAAYFAVVQHTLEGSALTTLIILFALVQLVVQLIFFLHLDRLRSRWKMATLISMLVVVAILVFGTLWIMHNLNYHMLTPEQINTYMFNQDSL